MLCTDGEVMWDSDCACMVCGGPLPGDVGSFCSLHCAEEWHVICQAIADEHQQQSTEKAA